MEVSKFCISVELAKPGGERGKAVSMIGLLQREEASWRSVVPSAPGVRSLQLGMARAAFPRRDVEATRGEPGECVN